MTTSRGGRPAAEWAVYMLKLMQLGEEYTPERMCARVRERFPDVTQRNVRLSLQHYASVGRLVNVGTRRAPRYALAPSAAMCSCEPAAEPLELSLQQVWR